MSSATLLDLASRCEQVTGSDRRLDADIWITLGSAPEEAVHDESCAGWVRAPRIAYGCSSSPRFTASLDAAMSLVPEGWGSCQVGNTDDGRGYAALAGNDAHMMAEDPDEFYVEADAATTPLALTAACLRAIASQGQQND